MTISSMTKATTQAACVALCAVSGVAVAEGTMRCGNDLVGVDDSRQAIYEACGEPKSVVELENGYGANVGSREVFDVGYGKSDRVVRFNADGLAIRMWEAD